MYFAANKNGRSSLNHLKSIRYWHRPVGGLIEASTKMKEVGAISPSLLKKDYMELFIGSCLGMGLQESEGKDFWIAKPETDPPDMLLMTMETNSKGGILFQSREIEIVRHLSNDISIEQRILNKDKSYPADYILVCYIEATGIAYLKDVADKLQGKMKHIEHVFAVFNGAMLSDGYMTMAEIIQKFPMTVVQLLPIMDVKTISIIDCVEKAMSDDKKLVYVDGMNVMYGLRAGDIDFPKIIQ